MNARLVLNEIGVKGEVGGLVSVFAGPSGNILDYVGTYVDESEALMSGLKHLGGDVSSKALDGESWEDYAFRVAAAEAFVGDRVLDAVWDSGVLHVLSVFGQRFQVEADDSVMERFPEGAFIPEGDK